MCIAFLHSHLISNSTPLYTAIHSTLTSHLITILHNTALHCIQFVHLPHLTSFHLSSHLFSAACAPFLHSHHIPSPYLPLSHLHPPHPSFPSLISEPSDPQDAEVANMYLSNYERFASTARFWTESYAMPRAAVAGAEVRNFELKLEFGSSTRHVFYC